MDEPNNINKTINKSYIFLARFENQNRTRGEDEDQSFCVICTLPLVFPPLVITCLL